VPDVEGSMSAKASWKMKEVLGDDAFGIV